MGVSTDWQHMFINIRSEHPPFLLHMMHTLRTWAGTCLQEGRSLCSDTAGLIWVILGHTDDQIFWNRVWVGLETHSSLNIGAGIGSCLLCWPLSAYEYSGRQSPVPLTLHGMLVRNAGSQIPSSCSQNLWRDWGLGIWILTKFSGRFLCLLNLAWFTKPRSIRF